MKIKCLLKCTFESNDYISFLSRQKDEVQLTPEFQVGGAEVRYEEERRAGHRSGGQPAE